ncbi:MAG TPA: hypothetical protein VLF71_02235 [Candidatus Saccharimonadales bacterium]|nr:hypothetical protein [Candidatus Saccharimonadales bacterium]
MRPETYAGLGELLLRPCPGPAGVEPGTAGGAQRPLCSLDYEVLEAVTADYDTVPPELLDPLERATHALATGKLAYYDLPPLDDDPQAEAAALRAALAQIPQDVPPFGVVPPTPSAH